MISSGDRCKWICYIMISTSSDSRHFSHDTIVSSSCDSCISSSIPVINRIVFSSSDNWRPGMSCVVSSTSDETMISICYDVVFISSGNSRSYSFDMVSHTSQYTTEICGIWRSITFVSKCYIPYYIESRIAWVLVSNWNFPKSIFIIIDVVRTCCSSNFIPVMISSSTIIGSIACKVTYGRTIIQT